MFGYSVTAAAKQHALNDWPNESVGYVVNGEYFAQVNIADKPREAFLVAKTAWSEDVQAVIHSHPVAAIDPRPYDQRAPTADDMLGQYSSDVPWGIIAATKQEATDPLWFGDQVLDQPLIGRKFVPNVTDCYELMRAYVHQKFKVYLPPVPRDRMWWETKQDVLADNFAKLGFEQVKPENVRAGDGLLIAIPATGVINHCAVLLENGLMLHHRWGELSRTTPWCGAWRRLTRIIVRKNWRAAQ